MTRARLLSVAVGAMLPLALVGTSACVAPYGGGELGSIFMLGSGVLGEASYVVLRRRAMRR